MPLFSETDAPKGSEERLWFADCVLNKEAKFGQFFPVAGVQPSKDGRGFSIALVMPASKIHPESFISWTWIWTNSPQGKKLKECIGDLSQAGHLEGTEKDKRGVLRSVEGELDPPVWVNISETGTLLWNQDYAGLEPD